MLTDPLLPWAETVGTTTNESSLGDMSGEVEVVAGTVRQVISSGPEDFGYTFVPTEEEGANGGTEVSSGSGGESASGDARQASAHSNGSVAELSESQTKNGGRPWGEKPYVYTPPKRHGKSALGSDDNEDNATTMVSILGGCCCCITVVFVIVGGILISYDQSRDSNGMTLAGSILLVLAAAALVLGCCVCCFGYLVAGEQGGSFLGGGHGYEDEHREVIVRLRRLNDRYQGAEDALDEVRLDIVGSMKEIKDVEKKEAKEKSEEEKEKRKELEERVRKDLEAGLSVKRIKQNYRPVAFLVNFEGDLMLSKMDLLRKQVSIIVNLGRAGVDQAVIVVTSPGGAVSPYGLAASQLIRIRKAGIKLVVCVDTVAASGGYMMASVGDTICAAPFAIVGSIGVVTHIPNFHRFLQKQDVDAYLFTAGKHKRTVDVIGEVTEDGKAKLQEELDDMHGAFKDHIALARPKLKETIQEVATGEYWLAVHARKKALVDEIMTSDEYLESISKENDIIEIVERKKKTAWSNIHAVVHSFKSAIDGFSARHNQSPTPMAIA